MFYIYENKKKKFFYFGFSQFNKRGFFNGLCKIFFFFPVAWGVGLQSFFSGVTFLFGPPIKKKKPGSPNPGPGIWNLRRKKKKYNRKGGKKENFFTKKIVRFIFLKMGGPHFFTGRRGGALLIFFG